MRPGKSSSMWEAQVQEVNLMLTSSILEEGGHTNWGIRL